MILSLGSDKPWSQYLCCIPFGNKDFVRDHPIATKLTDAELARFLSTIRDGISRTISTLPSHQNYVAQYCGAAAADAA